MGRWGGVNSNGRRSGPALAGSALGGLRVLNYGRRWHMSVVIELSDEIERDLRRSLGNLDGAAKEAMLVEFYRQEILTRYQLSQALGLSRLETDAVLKRHHVVEDLPSPEELEEDLRRAMSLVRP